MPKNIVICFDGTGNSFDNVDTESNVVKLYSTLVIDAEQIGYYHPGVGTMGAQRGGWKIEREWLRFKGLAFGAGLLGQVGDAYRYLMDNYADGDQVYLFGFSRGAFAARALASLLHVYGLLCAGNHEAIPYILRMYSTKSREADHQRTTFASDETFKWQFSHTREFRVHFCGLWDTVSSYGWIYEPIKLPFLGSNPIIDIGRQALSIHERRCFYEDNLWGEARPGQDMKQVWFLGVHSDVGGSYPEQESGLSKIALEWMLVEARQAGLRISAEKAQAVLGRAAIEPPIDHFPHYVRPDNNAALHESLQGIWWAFEFLPQADPHVNGKSWMLPLGRKRTIPPNSYIHQSVVDSKWKPNSLPPHRIDPWIKL